MRVIYFLLISAISIVLSSCNQLDISSNNTVLIVDMSAVAKATGRQELMQKELEFANLQLTEQLKLVASQLENNVSEEKEKLGDKPSLEEQKQFQELLLNAQNQLASTKNLAIQQASEFRSELILRFRKEISEIAQNIAHKRNSKLVVVAGPETLWFDSTTDITDEVIAVLRKRTNESFNDDNNTSSVSSTNEG